MFRIVAALLITGLIAVAAPARAAAPPVAVYGKLPAIDLMSLSPSGDRYAFVGVDGDKRKLVVSTADGRPLVLAPTGAAKVRSIDWAGEDHVLITTSATVDLGLDFANQHLELLTVVVVNLKTGKSFVVFENTNNVEPVVAGEHGVAQIGGRWYGFFGGVSFEGDGRDRYFQNAFADLYRVDLDTGDASLVARGGPTGDGWLVDRAGQVVARATYEQKSGDWQLFTGPIGGRLLASGNSKYGGVSFSMGRAADSLLIGRPKADGGVERQVIPLAGGPAVDVPDGDSILYSLHDRDSGLWIGSVAHADRPEPTLFDPAAEAKVQATLKVFPDQTVNFESWSKDLGKIIASTTGSGDSGTYWLVNMATGKADQLGFAYPVVAPAYVGTIRMVDWKAADGLQLHGVLSLPPGREAKNLPLVVMPHGGPEARDYPVFDWWAQAFASRGYAVFQPNFRGSGDYGAAFRNAGFGQWGRKMQTDISDGVAELARQGIVDPKRACIVGASYGGYAALAGVTVQHGLYRCSVAVAGVSDPAQMFVNDDPGAAERYWRAFMGATSIRGGELDPISPVKLAATADAPILLIHGKDDTVVPIVQTQEMKMALERAGKPVELVLLPTADHWFLHEDMRVAMVTQSVAFVEKYIPPDPEPSAAKTASAASTPSP